MAVIDRPWRRPGAATYARARLRNALRPPIEVYRMPGTVRKDADLPVEMSDGVTLRLNLFRPADAHGPLPTLLSAHPYGKDGTPRARRNGWSLNPQFRVMNQSEPLRISDQTSWEAPDPVWWSEQGYAVVNLDTRGGGHSGGRGDLLSDQEAEDIAQVIAWIAAQPWSNGRVGMLGVSYLALSQYKVAALQPPGLEAICPWEGFTDAYSDFFTPGGVVENGFARIWLALTQRVARLNVDLAAGRRRHPLRDEWWERLTPDLSKITVPMLVCTSFSDANLHSVGSMRAFERSGSIEPHAYTHRGPKWATFYGEQARTAQKAFFDRHLREEDVPALPTVRLEVHDRRDAVSEVRDENEWPLARTQWRSLHLSADGTLAPVPGIPGEVRFPLRRRAAAFEYRFDTDTELTGPMTVRLRVATRGCADPRLFVGVEKWADGRPVGFEGSYGYGRDHVAQGRLRLALRDGVDTLHPVADGEEMDVEIGLSPSATLFRAGESLRLLIGGRYLHPRNPLFGHFPAHYVPSRGGTATIVCEGSELTVPVIRQG
ncbi:CocE/NonD family hydrolase [Microbacterium proteolyticum]|uniref:CocE/NonD family hydrolase n=1 Tax=Microbacterium proteolyticum TaxID=1572644 RepID=UPI002416F2AE|nr:CocE/NonD family hydrolase [Microbacterium proteolyticum]